jgi:hypothetical protein
MNKQESATAIVLALGGIRDALNLDRVPVDVLWVAVKERMSGADYARVIEGLRQGDYVVIEDDKIELTPRGVKFAEEIHERLERNRQREDQHLGPQEPVGAPRDGSEEGRADEGRDAEGDPSRALQGPDHPVSRLKRIGLEALADVMAAHGSVSIPKMTFKDLVRAHMAHEFPGSIFVVHNTYKALRWLESSGLVAIQDGEYFITAKGGIASALVLTCRFRSLGQ